MLDGKMFCFSRTTTIVYDAVRLVAGGTIVEFVFPLFLPLTPPLDVE